MSFGVDIQLKNNQKRFAVGDTISGSAELTLPSKFPLSNVLLSFNCIGEVKWVEFVGPPRHMVQHMYYDQHTYHHDESAVAEKDAIVSKNDGRAEDALQKKLSVPFSFVIPKDKNLPSTMLSAHGLVKHFVRVAIMENDEIVKKFIKELIVESPFEKDLMITVGGTAEKTVLLHGGTVSMHATIGRKGFVAGETITVHVHVDNQTNTKVTPRLNLNQVQIYMCELRHKTIEHVLNDEPVLGSEIGAHSAVEELLDVKIPSDESMSIKSNLITVKYFVQVTLDIPHSFDLNINLPVVVTSKKVLQQLHDKKKNQPEMAGTPE